MYWGGATDMTFNFFLLTFSARSTHLIFLFFRWQNVRQGPRGDFAGERREAEPAVGDRAAVSGSERLSLHSASPQRCFNSASLARILPQRTATALWCHLSQCLRPRDSCSNRREWRTSSARKKLHQTVERFCKVRLYHVRNGDRNEASECLDLLRRPGSSQDCWKARMKCIVWRRTTHLFTVRPLWLSLFFSDIPIRH